MWEGGEGDVRGEGAVEGFGGGGVDGCEDEVVGVGCVLLLYIISIGEEELGSWGLGIRDRCSSLQTRRFSCRL